MAIPKPSKETHLACRNKIGRAGNATLKEPGWAAGCSPCIPMPGTRLPAAAVSIQVNGRGRNGSMENRLLTLMRWQLSLSRGCIIHLPTKQTRKGPFLLSPCFLSLPLPCSPPSSLPPPPSLPILLLPPPPPPLSLTCLSETGRRKAGRRR